MARTSRVTCTCRPDVLAADVTELDRRGFTVKIHAAGDRSIRAGLDAIEAARKANGESGLRHELAHASFIDPADIPRFARLGAVADYITDHLVSVVDHRRGARCGGEGTWGKDVADPCAARCRRADRVGLRLARSGTRSESMGRDRGARHSAGPARRHCGTLLAGAGRDTHRGTHDLHDQRRARPQTREANRLHRGRQVRGSHRARPQPFQGADRGRQRDEGAAHALRGQAGLRVLRGAELWRTCQPPCRPGVSALIVAVQAPPCTASLSGRRARPASASARARSPSRCACAPSQDR